MRFTVDLPMPPSANALFTARRWPARADGKKFSGRGLTPEYKRWRDGAMIVLHVAWRRAGSPKIVGQWGWEIRLNLDHGSDISNRIKAIEDLLVKAGIVPGDQWMDDGRVLRDRTIPIARVTVFQIE